MSATSPETVSLSAIDTLSSRLSPTAKIFVRGTPGWEEATQRWSAWASPGLAVAVEVGSEDDVANTVHWANEVGRPFLAVSGSHGATLGLGKLKGGVGILMKRLHGTRLAKSGKTVTAGGGVVSKKFLSDLWEMGKMIVAGCCETTGVVAPMLGGGHGFLQGRYGLMADQLVSARLVTASGDIVTASETENSELFWGLRGAGHNFGIITEFEYRVYDRTAEKETWSYDILVFKGEQLEEVYEAANRIVGGETPVELLHFSLMANNPAVDLIHPIIIFFLLYQGPTMPAQYVDPLLSLCPVSHTTGTTDFMGLPGVMGFSASDASCQPGKTWLRFPASTQRYDVLTMRKVYEIFASLPPKLAKHSSVITEAYSMHDVQAVKPESTAVPDRYNNLLMAAFIAYETEPVKDVVADEESVKAGKEIQRLLAASESIGLDAYVNYAFGDEGVESWYGREEWRLEKLRRLKKVWDPEGRFAWYCSIW